MTTYTAYELQEALDDLRSELEAEQRDMEGSYELCVAHLRQRLLDADEENAMLRDEINELRSKE